MPRKPNPKGSEGILPRRSRACASKTGDPCDCTPTFQASVYSKADSKRIRKTFSTLAEAKRWRRKLEAARDEGTLRAPAKITLNAAAEQWLAKVRTGEIQNRGETTYKPSVVRSYEQCLRLRVLPELGAHKLAEIKRGDLVRLVGRWRASGLDPSTIRNTILPLRAIYRDAEHLTTGDVPNPTIGVQTGRVTGRRERIASVDEASRLIEALTADRALWSTAFYAGLRHGEIKALCWGEVDLASGLIRVRASWDQQAGRVEPKSQSGKRDVPIIGRLRDLLLEHRMSTGRDAGLVFGRSATLPFCSSTVNNRAVRAWGKAKLAPIGLHEARHTFASYLIAAQLDLKAVSIYMGHASVAFTIDRYGHLLPDSHAERGAQLDAFLDRADTSARLAQFDASTEASS
jgi:integrase